MFVTRGCDGVLIPTLMKGLLKLVKLKELVKSSGFDEVVIPILMKGLLKRVKELAETPVVLRRLQKELGENSGFDGVMILTLLKNK